MVILAADLSIRGLEYLCAVLGRAPAATLAAAQGLHILPGLTAGLLDGLGLEGVFDA